MSRRICRSWPILALVLTLAAAPGAQAWGDGTGLFIYCHCPSMYSRLNYLAPGIYRYHAFHQPIGPYILPPDNAPCTPPGFRVVPYHCPAVSPANRPYYPNLGSGPSDAPLDPAVSTPGTSAYPGPTFGTPQ